MISQQNKRKRQLEEQPHSEQQLELGNLLSKAEAPFADYAREIRLTKVFIGFTLCVWLLVSWQMGAVFWERLQEGYGWAVAEQALFTLIIQGLLYGNFVYQLTRLGYLRRRLLHAPASAEELDALYDTDAPALAILVPSYKEEIHVVRRTLISAALQDYPNRRVVLLVDDPPYPHNPRDKHTLDAARRLPHDLQDYFNEIAAPFIKAEKEFEVRFHHRRMNPQTESVLLSQLYENAADLLEDLAESYPNTDHGDRLLKEKVFHRAASAHRVRAKDVCQQGKTLAPERARREYRKLAALFRVEFSSFERKRYENLSHEPNKAMNLNSYIRLLGNSWQGVSRGGKYYLEENRAGPGTFHVPEADFVITLDADSLIVPEYALVLINEMLREGNQRLAVAQTPYNTISPPVNDLERIAGATTDIQYLIHQGFTQYQATYWVGANAMLRVTALSDIRQVVHERGFEMPVYIQDRTVIEDTESSIDLVARGWRLYNYPERLAYSATPSDFGSLLIQRRRWSNGGLIILPKLLRYLCQRPTLAKIKEGFFRFHYLSSIASVNIGLLILLGFPFNYSLWLPLTAVPYFFLYARDLHYSGYLKRDLLTVYILNLLLIPVNLGGVTKSIHQGITGKRIPFGRTPKISGRTGVPALYCLFELALPLYCMTASGIDALHGRWLHAVFSFVNGILFVYGISHLIGIRNIMIDLSAGMGFHKPKDAGLYPVVTPSSADAALSLYAPKDAESSAIKRVV